MKARKLHKAFGDKVIMEFAVPFEQFALLKSEPGAHFALALMCIDNDSIAWYYAMSNIDMSASMFGNFVLIGESE